MPNKFEKIEEAIEIYKKMTAGNIMEDGRHRADYYGVQRRIAQAAYNFSGYIVTGTRHSCPIMHMQMTAIGNDLLDEWVYYNQGDYEHIQGFTDQYGTFLTREEAYPIALTAGQLLDRHEWGTTLYSESYI